MNTQVPQGVVVEYVHSFGCSAFFTVEWCLCRWTDPCMCTYVHTLAYTQASMQVIDE
jgi:hypothetical protein